MKFIGGNVSRDNKLSCEQKLTLAPGQSLPQSGSLSRVHVNISLNAKAIRASHSDKAMGGVDISLLCITEAEDMERSKWSK